MTRFLFLILLGVTFSVLLLSAPSLVSAEIKVTHPTNWQPGADNNSANMSWFQNSTKSVFVITKLPFTLPLIFVGPGLVQSLTDNGELESTDRMSFGHNNSNYGYRYFVNLNISAKSSPGLMQQSDFFSEIREGHYRPFKAMMILTEKQGDLYAISLFSPRENFDSKLNEIQPTIDSIQFTNSTVSR
jgi:hypothetical protein